MPSDMEEISRLEQDFSNALVEFEASIYTNDRNLEDLAFDKYREAEDKLERALLDLYQTRGDCDGLHKALHRITLLREKAFSPRSEKSQN